MADVLTIILLVIFLATSILIGYFASRKEDSEGYLIANRKLGIFQSVMTISGSFIGAMTLLVYTAFVFTYGISAIWIFIGYLIGFVIFTFFALHLKDYSKGKKFYTPADYFTHRFDRKTALYVMIAIFIFYFGALIAQFVGSGKILTEITGMNYSVSVIVIFVVIMSYLLMGGFKSVVKTDVFQFSILGILLLVIGYTIRGGLQVPVTHFNIFNVISGILFYLVYY